MWAPQFAPAGARTGFGLGFNVSIFEGQRRIGHNGAIYGFATELQALPESRLGVVVATTLDCANPVMTHIANEALRAMFRARDNQPLPALVMPTAVPSDQAVRLQGVYVAERRQPCRAERARHQTGGGHGRAPHRREVARRATC